MQLDLQREDFLNALQMLSGVVAKKTTQPILSHALLEATDRGLSLTSTNHKMQMVCSFFLPDAQKNLPEPITLPLKKCLDICRCLPEGSDIRLKIEKGSFKLFSLKSRFHILSLPSAQFPSFVKSDLLMTIEVSASAFKKLFSLTTFSMADQDVRNYLNGVLLELEGSTMTMLSTDGHRLSCASLSLPENQESLDNYQVIIPRRAIPEIRRCVSDDEKLVISFFEKHFSISQNGVEFATCIVDAKFPGYRHLIPASAAVEFFVDRDLFKAALQRMLIMADSHYFGVTFTLDQGVLYLNSHNPEQEQASEELDIEYTGEPGLELAFNIVYLLDILSVIDEGPIRFSLASDNTSVKVQSVKDESSVFVVMPIRF